MVDARQFFPGIHALRAVAATLVVIEHAAFASDSYSTLLIIPYFSYGRVGVILFFAISGFVIALQRTKPIGIFVVHRLLRIYPSYWLAMILAAAMLSATGHHVSANAPAIFLYPSKLSDGALQIPYWTLAYEMTFYTLAAIAFGLRLSDRTLTIAAVLWVVAVNLFAPNPADATEYEFPGHSILLSAAVQVFPMGLICGIHFETLKRAGGRLYLLAAAAAFAASTFFAELTVPKILMLGICSSCLIVAVADLDIRARVVKLLGDASYGIYLLHFPAMVFTLTLWPSLGFAWCFIVGMASGTAFGWLDYNLYGWMVTNITAKGSNKR